METRALVAGLIITLGVFALKAGMGLGYLASRPGGRFKAMAALAVYCLVMAGVFPGLSHLAGIVSGSLASGLMNTIVSYGMDIHFAAGTGLLAWGVFILSRPRHLPAEAGMSGHAGDSGTLGWLFLSMPCPVCLMVIFLDLCLFRDLFPDNSWYSLWLPYLGFAAITVLTAVVSGMLTRRSGISPEYFLGWTMMLCAAYFAMNVVVLPHFQEAKTAYSLALNQAQSGVIPGVSGSSGRFIPKASAIFLFPGLFAAGMLSRATFARKGH